jgi:TnpA family transposase
MGFGAFRMLGLQLAPQLADAGSATLYRVDPGANYGPLQGLVRARVNTAIIGDHWDDLLRVAGSLVTGAVKPTELFRYLVGGGHPTPVGRALIELGKLDRSGWLATYFDDDLLRRRVGTQKTAKKPATPWPAGSSTARRASCASATAKARRTSCPRSASWSTSACCGTPSTLGGR